MHVYLTGFMGAGKSTVGKLLARFLARPFIDLDELIEASEGLTVSEIFRLHGEARFREIESRMLRRLEEVEPAVVAMGGGTLSQPENREWIAGRGTTIWLDAPINLLLDRLRTQEQDRRPLYEDEAQARRLYQTRLSDYRDSDLQVEISSSDSAADVAAAIRHVLEASGCVT